MLLNMEHLLHWRKTRRLQAITCFVQTALVYSRKVALAGYNPLLTTLVGLSPQKDGIIEP